MSLRHSARNAALTAAFLHPAAVGVLARRGPKATRDYLTEIYRCSKTEAGLHLRLVSSDDLVGDAVTFQVFRPAEAAGSMTLTEVAVLSQLVAAWKPTKILEIGTFRGLTTLNLARNAPTAEVHTVDLPEQFNPTDTAFANNDPAIIAARGSYFYRETEVENRVIQHHGDTATYDLSGKVGPGVDVCLIDAAHTYEYVRSDTARVLKVMSDRGWLLWHDYGRNDFLPEPDDAWGVSHFLHEMGELGVRVIRGTSLGILRLDPSIKSRLAEQLSG